jgi:hypothetical protein
MHLRIERLRLKSGADSEFAAFYRDEALPIFARTPGCRFAALLAPWHASEHLALTLWERAESSRTYERSALFQFFLGRIAPLLDLALEDKVNIDPDTVLTVDPNDTVSEIAASLPTLAFSVEDAAPLAALADDAPARFVRVTEIRVDPSCLESFRAAYRDEIAPALAAQAGCSGALLAERADDATEMRSMSLELVPLRGHGRVEAAHRARGRAAVAGLRLATDAARRHGARPARARGQELRPRRGARARGAARLGLRSLRALRRGA